MNCSCCGPENINDLDNTFTTKRAQKEARGYLKKGLARRSQKLVAHVEGRLPPDATMLEIGCGAGGLHHELLRRDVVREAVGVDASSGYLAAARENAQKLGLSEAVTYHQRDFAQFAHEFMPADLVVMDRVICCYPHLEQLLGQAAQHSKRFLAISFPFHEWWMRWPFKVIDTMLTLTGSQYHPYLHPLSGIVAVAKEAGLKPVHRDRHHFLWRIMVFERV